MPIEYAIIGAGALIIFGGVMNIYFDIKLNQCHNETDKARMKLIRDIGKL